MNSARNIVWISAMPTLLLVAGAVAALAGSVGVPHVFVPGQVASADEVNANFQELAKALDEHAKTLAWIESLEENGGLVRAAAHVSSSGPFVSRSFSNFPGSPTITVTRTSIGHYEVDFGTWVAGRHYSAVLGNASGGIGPILIEGRLSVTPKDGDPDRLCVVTRDLLGQFYDLSFYIQVY